MVGRFHDEDTSPKLGRHHDRLGRLAEVHDVGADHPLQSWIAIAELAQHMGHTIVLNSCELQAGGVLCGETEKAAFGVVQGLRQVAMASGDETQ